MKKLWILTLAITGLTMGTNLAMAQQDAKAKVVLDKMTGKVKSMTSMKANFTLIAKDANGKVVMNQNGTLQMKGDKYSVVLPKQTMICDGKTMWTYMKDNKEVQVANYDANEVQISPKKLFATTFTTDYNYVYAGEKNISGKAVDIVYLTPKGKKDFKSVTILIDKNGQLVSGSVEENKGGYYTFNLKGIQANAASSDALYTFDAKKYPGVEVIDLR